MEEEQSRLNFVPCLRWVKQGVAKANPEKVQLTTEELTQIIKDTKERLRITEENENGEGTSQQDESMPVDQDDEFNLEKYDDEAEDNRLALASVADLPAEGENFDDGEDSEVEDDIIKKDDNLILVGKVEEDASVLEVYVYNEAHGDFYVHHDFLLPAFPLCIEWLDHEPGSNAGNYCAIGSMNPVIDIWDLDIINCLEPAYTLGQPENKKKKQKRVGHKDAVLALSWNSNFHHILASGSADKTVMLWDIDEGKPSVTIKSFNDRVQCLQWHTHEAQTLLGGACDKSARVFDCRSPETHQTWTLKGEAENLIWNPHEPFTFIAGTSNGYVQCFDCRKGEVWSVQAHSSELSGLVVSNQCPGFLVSASTDGTLKTWDILNNSPELVLEKDLKIGKILCLDLNPNSPFTITAGGDNKENNLKVLDLMSDDVVKHKFESRELIQLVKEESG